MTKNFHRAALAAILGGAVSLAPVKAADPAVRAPQPGTEEALKKQIEENNKLLAEVQKSLVDIKDIKERLYGRRDEQNFPIESDRGLIADVRSLNDKVEEIRKQLEGMRNQSLALKPGAPETKINIPGTASTPAPAGTVPNPMPQSSSAYAPAPAPAAATGKGTIKLVNDYPIEISMVINDKQSYKIGPHGVQTIDVPAGEFTYHLLQGGAAPVKSTIKDKETVTLRIK